MFGWFRLSLPRIDQIWVRADRFRARFDQCRAGSGQIRAGFDQLGAGSDQCVNFPVVSDFACWPLGHVTSLGQFVCSWRRRWPAPCPFNRGLARTEALVTRIWTMGLGGKEENGGPDPAREMGWAPPASAGRPRMAPGPNKTKTRQPLSFERRFSEEIPAGEFQGRSRPSLEPHAVSVAAQVRRCMN